MAFKVSNAASSLRAERYLDKSQQQIQHSLGAIASGSRIVQAGDDAAGFAIAETLKAQLAGTQQAEMNAKAAKSFIQTAEGGLNEQNNILIRLRELAVYSASDTVDDKERGYLDTEFQQLSSELDRIAKSTKYGSTPLLTGSGDDYEFHVGPDSGSENVISFRLDSDTRGDALGISGLDVEDKSSANDALDSIDEALDKVATARASFGAMQSRFQYAIDNLGIQNENIESARSQIEDVDLAQETSKLAQAQIQQQAGTAVLAQANTAAERALRLLNT